MCRVTGRLVKVQEGASLLSGLSDDDGDDNATRLQIVKPGGVRPQRSARPNVVITALQARPAGTQLVS